MDEIIEVDYKPIKEQYPIRVACAFDAETNMPIAWRTYRMGGDGKRISGPMVGQNERIIGVKCRGTCEIWAVGVHDFICPACSSDGMAHITNVSDATAGPLALSEIRRWPSMPMASLRSGTALQGGQST